MSAEKDETLIPVKPHFEQQEELKLGDQTFRLKISELVRQEDLDGYHFLEQFHYRSFESLSETEAGGRESGGRKAVLLCSMQKAGNWSPIGYIELQMPLMMCRPRHELFNRPFSHPTRDVAWDKWDQHAMRSYVNLIVRIARVVTNPEFRGLGLAKVLINAAKTFSAKRWQIGGRRPLFMEISAEMLRYSDFVSSAGMHYVGATEGNLERLNADMRSMLRNYEISSGIMSLQKKYLTTIRKASEELGISIETALERLKNVCDRPDLLKELSTQEWFLYKSVIRLPRPYYIQGLDAYSEQYVVSGTRVDQVAKIATRRKRPEAGIEVSNLNISLSYEVPDSDLTRTMLGCFGIGTRTLDSTVISNFSLRASAGNIILITGASGTGKTLLLSSLDQAIRHPYVVSNATACAKVQGKIGWMRDISGTKPLIEELAKINGTEAAVSALNRAGLSEALVYLKPYKLLSRGQRYRARLASLLLSDAEVWLLDEFCADLDPISAKIVSMNLRKLVVRNGVIAVVAAANNWHFVDALKPTQVINLQMGAKFRSTTFKEYRDELHAGT